MRGHTHPAVVAGIAAAAVVMLAAAPFPPQQPHTLPNAVRDVRLTAAPELGSIPLAFIRNQFQYCSLICPFGAQGAITVPAGAAQAPGAFLNTLASTGSPLRAIGAAAASATGPANAAVTPLINNDVFLVVPKAFHALDVAVVAAIDVALSPGDVLGAVQRGRTRILDALNQPVGTPTTPTGARNILQVLAVSAVDVTTAVAFQAGELLLSGAVQIADAAAQELSRSGDPGAALAAGARQAGHVVSAASAPVVAAVNTAVTNIRNSLADPFPSATKTTSPPRQAAPIVRSARAAGEKPLYKPTFADGPNHSSSLPSTTAASSSVRSASAGRSSDSATPSAKKNTMKSGPPR